MKLHEIMGGFKVDPERERQFAKQMCQSLHGCVRMNTGFRLWMLSVFVLLVLWMLWQCITNPGINSMLLMIVMLSGGFLAVWYVMTWELTFDGESGFMSYHTLFQGTIRFHVSEITSIRKKASYTRHSRSRSNLMYISVENTNILVVLSQDVHDSGGFHRTFGGGYVDANKLEQYLDLYQNLIALPEASLIREGVDPRIAAAIASAKIETDLDVPEKTDQKKSSMKKEVDKVSLKKEIPDTSRPEPSASEQKKSEVDVDALFSSVLQKYGKQTKAAKPQAAVSVASTKLKQTDISGKPETDTIFDSVWKVNTKDSPETLNPRVADAIKAQTGAAANQSASAPKQLISEPSRSEEEVDALFKSVLKQHGKLVRGEVDPRTAAAIADALEEEESAVQKKPAQKKVSLKKENASRPKLSAAEKKNKEVVAEALFDAVLRQYGKK